MKSTILPSATPDDWNAEALYFKAERYIQQMSELDSDEWEYALWSSLSLEFLARSALANISPSLLADAGKNWANLYHALGFTPNEEKFTPKSISISDVFKRLTSILPEFTNEHEKFGIRHTGMRNTELHSGVLAFDGVKSSTWKSGFYQTCTTLLASMDMTLQDFLGAEEASVAEKMIAAAVDESAKATKSDVQAHKKVWLAKNDEEQATLGEQAKVWASRHVGHRVDCVACDSKAIVIGEPVSPPTRKLHNDKIKETQEYLPHQFECIACGLKISGLSRLTAIDLGNLYKKTQFYDPAELYVPDDDYYGYEDDNNEW